MSLLPIKMKFEDSFFEGEWRCEYYVTPTMKKVWAVELDLLNEFIAFCEKYEIKYYIAFGSLLGALRHGGFIPWDDDIDVVVSRNEYEKIEKYAPKYFKEPYFFQTERTDPGFSRHFARLRNSSTTAIPIDDLDYNIKVNQGIWLDIFPMDNIPDSQRQQEEWINELNRLHNKMGVFSRLTLHYKKPLNNKSFIKRIILFFGPLTKLFCEIGHIKNPYYEKYEQLSKKYSTKDTKKIGVPWFFSLFKDRIIWDRKWFDSTKTADFENIKVVIPENSDVLLKHIYNDWHVFVKGSESHPKNLFDPENSYMIYLKNPELLRERVALVKNENE